MNRKLKSCVSQWLGSKGWGAKGFIQNNCLLCFVGILFAPVPSNYLHRKRGSHTQLNLWHFAEKAFCWGMWTEKSLEKNVGNDEIFRYSAGFSGPQWSDGLDSLWKLNWVKISNELGVNRAGMLYLPNLLAMFSKRFTESNSKSHRTCVNESVCGCLGRRLVPPSIRGTQKPCPVEVPVDA